MMKSSDQAFLADFFFIIFNYKIRIPSVLCLQLVKQAHAHTTRGADKYLNSNCVSFSIDLYLVINFLNWIFRYCCGTKEYADSGGKLDISTQFEKFYFSPVLRNILFWL